MISIVKHIIENDFMVHCEKCGKGDVGLNICERISGEDSSSKSILETLVQIVDIGNHDDLISFIDERFGLPLGLKHNLIRLLRQLPEQKPLHQIDEQNMSTLFDQNRRLTYLLRVWKDGMLSLDVLFSHINEMVVEERLSFSTAQRLVELILAEGGYTQHPLHGRSHIKSAMCHLLEISTYACNKYGLEVYTHSGSYCEVLPGQMHRSDIYSTTAQCTSSTTEFWWEHIGETDRLDFIIPISSKSPLGTENKTHYPRRCVREKPTLLIGDSIKLHEVTVEISRVIMVDSLSKSCGNGIQRFAVLLEGFLTPGPGHSLWGGSATAMQESGLFDYYRDGETEVPSPRTHGMGSSSSVDSNEDELQYSLPPFETKPRYFLVFVVVQEAVPLVACVCSLYEHILHDQLPTSVRYIAQGLAVVSGSNGLLGAVKVCAPVATGTSELLLKPRGGRQPVVCMGGLRTSFSFYSLVEDSLVAADMPEPELSHGGDAVITAVDSVQITRVGEDAATVVLVSGDTAGAVCLWKLDATTGIGVLCLPPYQVTSEARRICSLQLSPSGEHIAVGLFDRLLLLGISTPAVADSGISVLYVRTCLDMMARISALYTVAFYPDIIRVWRITNEAHAPPVAGASHLTELDSFADQDNADPDTPTSPSMPAAASRLADRADLGTYSVDAEMSDSPLQGDRLGLRTDSPNNFQSPNPPPAPRSQNTTAEVAVSYGPGITVTTWLHHNVDSLSDRRGSAFNNLNAEFPCNTDAAMVTTATGTRIASVVDDAALTWLDVPTTESNCPDQAALMRSVSGNSANISTYTADGTHCVPHPPALLPSHGTSNTVDLQSQSVTTGSDEHAALTVPRYLEVGTEYMLLYAPHQPSEGHPLSPPAVHAPAPIGISPPTMMSTSGSHPMVSEAIPGILVEMSESTVSFTAMAASDTPSSVTPVVLQVRLPSVEPDTSEDAVVQEPRSVPTSAPREVGLLGGAIIDHRARHSTHYTSYGMVRPSRSQHHRRSPEYDNLKLMLAWFQHDSNESFLRVKTVLSILCACYQPPTVGIIAAAMEVPHAEVSRLIRTELGEILAVSSEDKRSVVTLHPAYTGLYKWLCSEDIHRVGAMFWLDAGVGHNLLCSLYLRYCGNKSVAVEHTWQDYLRTYGPTHLRYATRGLRLLTVNIRKIDETANIRVHLPRQIGYIVGLYEIYARRVGLRGRIPSELGQLRNLRVLSMGNNHLSGELPASLGDLRNLQRIVLHQNNLRGPVPLSLGALGCIVNLAGNPLLHHGEDVPAEEKQALVDLYQSTRGAGWNTKTHWCSSQPVAKWYKVGVLTSHVHSIVMSSNNMEGTLPASINKLTYLRMIELATMPGLVGKLPKELCTLTTLRRLCICRCGLTGSIPSELGKLVGLEELQLFGNQLTGTVPSSLSHLTNLKLLSLGEYTGGNSFQAEALPICLASLVNLEALFMANCNIRGPLPDWIGNLTELRQLDLQRNQLSGPLPSSIGALQNLLYLNMKDNQQLTGRLPLPELLSLTKLNRLSLVHCNFHNTDHAQAMLSQHLPRCKVWI